MNFVRADCERSGEKHGVGGSVEKFEKRGRRKTLSMRTLAVYRRKCSDARANILAYGSDDGWWKRRSRIDKMIKHCLEIDELQLTPFQRWEETMSLFPPSLHMPASRKTSPQTKTIATKTSLQKTVIAPFSFFAPDAKSVSVAGTFNKWDAAKHPLKRNAKGLWSVDIALAPGRYEYRFVINGTVWEHDHQHPGETCPNGKGGVNSVRKVA